MFERRSFAEADVALGDFDNELMAAARTYYVTAQRAAGDGIQNLVDQFTRYRHHGLEINGLRVVLQPGERVQSFGWLKAKTDRRTIARAEMRDAARPSGWSNDASWTKQFIPLDQLARLEAEETENAARQGTPQYGRNMDYPGGVRPQS